MKKIQVIFAAAAIMLSVAGVYASSVLTTVYYKPFYENRTLLRCDVEYTEPCQDSGIIPCAKDVVLQDMEGTNQGTFNVLIGKRIDGGNCLQVVKPN